MKDLFEKIMSLIEKETDMPIYEKYLEEWISRDEVNKEAYEIYKIASIANQKLNRN